MKTHYINGKWLSGSGDKFSSINPANMDTIWQGNAAKDSEVQDAVQAARQAFDSWAALDLEERIKFLEEYTESIKAKRDELAKAIAQETGKPLWESTMEVGGMIGKLKIAIQAFQERSSTTIKEIKTGSSITRHRAHGVVAIFGPFNFPGHISNGHIVPALLAGNTVVFKPSEQTPLVAQMIAEIFDSINLPAGVFNLVQGAANTGIALSKSPELDGLFFTGSSKTGRLLHKEFAGHPEKILALEMGGNNPLIVWDTQDLEAAAYLTIQSAYITAGQRCVCARRLIVQEGSEEFIKILTKMIEGIRVGAYDSEPEPFMGPLISMTAAEQCLNRQKELLASGATTIVEAKQIKENLPFISPGLIDVTAIKNHKDIETFGPLLQLIKVKDFDSAIKEANNTSYGLAAGLLSNNRDLYEKFFRHARAGVINWNQQITGASSSAPFGGIGISGNHRPSAYYAADYCAYPIASLENEELKLPEKFAPGIESLQKQ